MMRFVEIFMTAAAASVRTCLFKNKINQSISFPKWKIWRSGIFRSSRNSFWCNKFAFWRRHHGTMIQSKWKLGIQMKWMSSKTFEIFKWYIFALRFFFLFLISFSSIWPTFAALFILCACDGNAAVGDETFLDEEATAFIQKNFPNAMKVGEMKVEDLSENDIQAPDQQWFVAPFFSGWGDAPISKWKL
jgi:hypothetical protein